MSLFGKACMAAFFYGGLLLAAEPSAVKQDWAMWGGSPSRNNVSAALGIPRQWNTGKLSVSRPAPADPNRENIRWIARQGSTAHATPAIADGRVFLGANNAAGYLSRRPREIDLGCLLCFRESDGGFLWQYSSPKSPEGRVRDWPQQGICSTPIIEGKRVWFVDNLGRVVCLDSEGFHDQENDGPVKTLWETQYETDLFVTTRLEQKRLPDDVQEALVQAGGWPRGNRVKALEAPNQWSIQSLVPRDGKKPKYRAELRDGQVCFFLLDDQQPPSPDRLLFQLDNRRFPGLLENKIDSHLQKRLNQHGVPVSPKTVLQPEAAGKRWTFTIEDNGLSLRHRLEIGGRRLRVSREITDQDTREADIVWRYDMMRELGVRQHNMANCSPTIWGDVLFVSTSNGVDETHLKAPAPDAPSLIALDKTSGELLWSDDLCSPYVMHGQWSSPAVGVLGGVPQVIFAGGDGWVYSFRADRWDREKKRPILLWKFDANPKTSQWKLGGRGDRSNIIACPVIARQRVYIATGQDPEHGDGPGDLYCIDPSRRGDVSPELAVKLEDGKQVILPRRRGQAVDEKKGEKAIANPNSAVIWRYQGRDNNKDGKMDFEETFHRAMATPAIRDGLLVAVDTSGIVHCLDADSGKVHWTCDLLASCWGSPLIVDKHIYIGDEDGDVAIFPLTGNPQGLLKIARWTNRQGKTRAFPEPARQVVMETSVYATPVAANGVLYISQRGHLVAIAKQRPAP